ncbi:MAG: hypothetical protein KatS3mg076_2413 [Candidatus Binatia bacterium]|nr:MAG: hypothetical protein KatS3mg076_2413 [Candidatus Binatia bacterium]
MDLYRIGFKFLAQVSGDLDLEELIPVFHRWIQTSAVDGLLIDVANYAHVHHGPGVMLIAHEGHYATDLRRGRFGLQYERKRPMTGSLEERFLTVCRTTLRACARLEGEPELEGRVRFPGNELWVWAIDRLWAPNTEETFSRLRPVLSGLLERLYPGADLEIEREPDPREPFLLGVKASESVPVAELLRRISPNGAA